MNQKILSCPNCLAPFKDVVLPSHYDLPVKLEQCPKCGGVWFDEHELFTLKQGSSSAIEQVDPRLLAMNVPIRQEMLCPKDKTVLKKFRDMNFPKEIEIEFCTSCNGFWMNRGELTAFQKYREERSKKSEAEDKKKDDALSKKIDALLAQQSSSETFDQWGAWGKRMSRPVNVLDSNIDILGGNTHTQSNFSAGNILYALLRILMLFLTRR